MARKSLGYTELEWVCPNCNGRNPGRVKVCRNCGAAQPADVQFIQAGQENLVSDAEALEMAAAAADIHCPFCGTRNRASAEKCVRCGGDLTGAEARESGQVLGAHQSKPKPDIVCAACGTPNPAANLKCSNCGSNLESVPVEPAPPASPAAARGISPLLIGGVAVAVLVLILVAFFVIRGSQRTAFVGRVENVSWQRSIVLLGQVAQTNATWQDQIPQGAEVASCSERERGRSDTPVANSVEVCGTPYTVDTGTGFGEVVQDCYYEVYDDWCEYTTMGLAPIGTFEESGADLTPRWPETRLGEGQQLGERTERYRVIFEVDGQKYDYTFNDPELFSHFPPGSEWQVEINGFGDIVSVERER